MNLPKLQHLDANHVQRHLVDLISKYIKVEADIAKPLATQGMDSLSTMELRQNVQVSMSRCAHVFPSAHSPICCSDLVATCLLFCCVP